MEGSDNKNAKRIEGAMQKFGQFDWSCSTGLIGGGGQWLNGLPWKKQRDLYHMRCSRERHGACSRARHCASSGRRGVGRRTEQRRSSDLSNEYVGDTATTVRLHRVPYLAASQRGCSATSQRCPSRLTSVENQPTESGKSKCSKTGHVPEIKATSMRGVRGIGGSNPFNWGTRDSALWSS